MNHSKHIALVANPTRNQAADIAQHISGILSQRGVLHEKFLEDWPADFLDFSDVWIIGGDGTLNFFVNRYPELSLPLSIFKAGTGNDFHFMLYGALSVEQQVEKVMDCESKAVDAGICNGIFFMNNLGIGFDARVTKDLLSRKKKPGKASYYSSVIKNIFFFKEFAGQLGEREEDLYFMINICNGRRTGGGFYVAPAASVTDGLLDINLVTRINSWNRLKYLPIIEEGRHQDLSLSFLQHFQSDKLLFRTTLPAHAHVDGEYFQDSCFEIACLPGRFLFRY